MNIALFGGGLQILSTARSLKEKGYNVDVIGTHNEISKRSRFVKKCIQIDIESLELSELIPIITREAYSVIIPTEDDYSTWLSKHKSQIESNSKAKCAVMDYDVYSLASNKTRLMAFCKEHAIPHPKTEIIDNNFEELAEAIGFPSLIKPSHSAGSRGIKLVNNIEELRSSFEDIKSEYGECTLQEYINSQTHYFNAMLYRTAEGKYGNHAITKIMRYYPIKGGSSSFCTSIENEKILEICKKALDKLNWVGFADFDILEKDNGDYRIIEINPRIPASIHAAVISGVHFGEMIVKNITEGTLPAYTYTPGMQLRCLGLDIAWFLSSPDRWNCKPSWFKFFGSKLHYQEGGAKDFAAMCTSILMGIKKQLNPEFRKKKKGMN